MSFIIQEQAAPVLFEIGKEEPTGAGGTIDFYLADQDFLYFEGNASANFAIDLAYDAATTLDDALNVDDLVTFTLAAKNGTTPYYLTNFQIDGGAGTTVINWEGELAPISGNANSIDYYTFKVLKTSGNQYTVFASVNTTSLENQPVNKQVLINSPASGTSTIYLSQEDILFYEGTATSGFNINATFATGITLNQVMATGDVKEFSFKAVCGSGSVFSNFEIDSGSATVTLFSQVFPPAVSAGSLNVLDFQISKIGDNNFYVDVDKKLYAYPGGSSFGPSVVEVLVIAGGGGGTNAFNGGGGGAGGYRINTSFSRTQDSYTVTIGAGGPRDTAGSISTFGTFESAGGGKGGGPGGAGGSGGGSTVGTGAGGAGNTPNVSPSQGNNGGAGGVTHGGGGGGAGAVGSAGGGAGGNGGAGTASSITGSSVTRAGGGGGAIGGTGGAGGGGNDDFAGSPNTGGGGGRAGAGGSGVVILAFPTSSVLPSIGAGLTYSISTSSRAGYYVITFTQGSDTISWG